MWHGKFDEEKCRFGRPNIWDARNFAGQKWPEKGLCVMFSKGKSIWSIQLSQTVQRSRPKTSILDSALIQTPHDFNRHALLNSSSWMIIMSRLKSRRHSHGSESTTVKPTIKAIINQTSCIYYYLYPDVLDEQKPANDGETTIDYILNSCGSKPWFPPLGVGL